MITHSSFILIASCGGDPNAEAGCGQNCGRRCSNYKEKNEACPAICQINGCDCKKDYVFDDNIRQCVRPCDCSKLLYLLFFPKASSVTFILLVISTNTDRLTDTKEMLLTAPTCPNNEQWNTCANGGCYSARNCSDLGNPTKCVHPIKCIGGCLCKDGYLKNDKTGVCVPVEECPSKRKLKSILNHYCHNHYKVNLQKRSLRLKYTILIIAELCPNWI